MAPTSLRPLETVRRLVQEKLSKHYKKLQTIEGDRKAIASTNSQLHLEEMQLLLRLDAIKMELRANERRFADLLEATDKIYRQIAVDTSALVGRLSCCEEESEEESGMCDALSKLELDTPTEVEQVDSQAESEAGLALEAEPIPTLVEQPEPTSSDLPLVELVEKVTHLVIDSSPTSIIPPVDFAKSLSPLTPASTTVDETAIA